MMFLKKFSRVFLEIEDGIFCREFVLAKGGVGSDDLMVDGDMAGRGIGYGLGE